MKKFLALLLAAVTCLSLVACNNTPTEENEDSPSSTEHVAKDHIELTLENFYTYFEFKEEGYFTKDESGKVDELRFRHYYKLKDDVKINEPKSTVEIVYKHTASLRDIEFDLEKEKYTLGENSNEKETIDNRKIKHLSKINEDEYAILLYQPVALSNNNDIFFYYSDFEVTDVKGTLYFAE